MENRLLRIGPVAERAGVRVDTVRYYEKRGLLRPHHRERSGYRLYRASTVDRIRFIKSLQDLGLTLEEIVAVMRNVDEGDFTCSGCSSPLERVLGRIDAELSRLRTMRATVETTMKACERGSCGFSERAEKVRQTG